MLCVSTILYHWFRSKFDFRNFSIFPITCFPNELKCWRQNRYLFQKVESSFEEERANEIFQTFLAIILWHFLIISLRSELPQVKRYFISSIPNLVHELLHELSKDFRLRILGNEEILEKCQMWVEMQPIAQSFLQKLNVYNSCQKTRKMRYYIFKVLSNFTVFL